MMNVPAAASLSKLILFSLSVSPSDVLALPIFKQEDTSLTSDHETKNPPFQYVLCAATSPAVKLHDETLTYLNQGEPRIAAAAAAAEFHPKVLAHRERIR